MSSQPPTPKTNAARNPPSAAQVQRGQATAPSAQSTVAPTRTNRTAPVLASAAPPQPAAPPAQSAPAASASSRTVPVAAATNANAAGVPPSAAPAQSAPITASSAPSSSAPATLGAAAAPSQPVPTTQVGPASESNKKNEPPPIPPPPIFTEGVNELIIISDRSTYDQLLNEVGRKHLLVEFFAPWCGACMLMNRKLEELATSYNGKLIIAKVNVDDCEQIAIDNDISMMPSFLLMKENQILERFAGSNEEKLTNTIKKYVGEPTDGVEETISLKADQGV